MNITNIHQLTFNIEISLFHFTCAIHALTSNHVGKSKLVPKADLLLKYFKTILTSAS